MVRRKSRLPMMIQSASSAPSISYHRIEGDKTDVTGVPIRPSELSNWLEDDKAVIIYSPAHEIRCQQILEVMGNLGLFPSDASDVICIDNGDELDGPLRDAVFQAPNFLFDIFEGDEERGIGRFTKDSLAPSGVRYLGPAPDEIAIQTQLLSAAASAVMCCFMGRGAPAGVDWMGVADRLYSNRRALNKLVYATSFGHERFSHIPGNKLAPDSWRYVKEMLSHGEFQRGQLTASSFREDFSVSYLTCASGDDAFAKTAFNMSQLVLLWRYVMGENELWDDMPDVNPDAADAAERFIEIGRSVSIDTYIGAFYEGVPLEDLMA